MLVDAANRQAIQVKSLRWFMRHGHWTYPIRNACLPLFHLGGFFHADPWLCMGGGIPKCGTTGTVSGMAVWPNQGGTMGPMYRVQYSGSIPVPRGAMSGRQYVHGAPCMAGTHGIECPSKNPVSSKRLYLR